ASAGAAVGAFGLAVKPQVTDIGKLSDALDTYHKAVDASGAGSEQAKAALEAYNRQLKGMPPATADAAGAFLDLRESFNQWSDSLAGDTMPVFTKGLRVAQQLLPSLTPLVKAGASALSGFMDTLQRDAQSGAVGKFTSKLAGAARKVLPDLLSSLRNIAIGFGGIVSAFLPFADDMSGGLEDLTAKFADFGRNLGNNQAFQDWMEGVSDQAPDLLDTLGDLVQIIMNVAEALGPFTGLTLKVTEALADFVAAIPQDTMDWLAPTIAGIVLAIKAWSVAQGVLNVVLAANPIGIVVLAIAALAAGLIYAYKHSETFRRIVDKAFSVVKEKGKEMWDKIRPGLEKMKDLLGSTLPEAAAILADELGKLADKAQDVADKVLGIKDKISQGKVDKGWTDDLKDALDAVGRGAAGTERGFRRLQRTVNAFNVHLLREYVIPTVRTLVGWINKVNGKAVQVAAKVAGTEPVKTLITWIRRLNGKIVQVLAKVAGTGPVKTLITWIKRLAGKVVRVGANVFGSGAVQGLIGWIGRLAGKTVRVGASIFGFAAGGITHAAEGGPRGNLTLVGEQGPEIVRLPQGAQVYPHGQSMGMLGAMAGGGAVRLVWG
ncbi:MAG TPA: hypothetical protein VIR33_12835, partial [Thermopolyspora sp.]